MLAPPPPVHTVHLLRPLLGELLALLRGLEPAQWAAPTVAGGWRVRDVAAHLLDGDLRKIAVYRDDHALPMDAPIASDRDLARFVGTLNATGVAWAARLSPRLLADLLAVTGEWVADVLGALPPHGASRFPVSWAGEATSENWMDAGREYTERWHHQMQIRDAVGAPPVLLAPRWLVPLLDLSVRALPASYAALDAPSGTNVALEVVGDHGDADAAPLGAWSVVRDDDRWTLRAGVTARPDATVRATADAAWRLLYNALPDPARAPGLAVRGDASLAEPLLRARAVIVVEAP
jgi:hypothetical protein